MAATFTGLLESLQAQESPDFAELVKEHAPPGGGNAQLTALMEEAGIFEGMARAVDEGPTGGSPGQRLTDHVDRLGRDRVQDELQVVAPASATPARGRRGRRA